MIQSALVNPNTNTKLNSEIVSCDEGRHKARNKQLVVELGCFGEGQR